MNKNVVVKDPVLYILMRTDLASMNPGKGMAQACHAANFFAFRAFNSQYESVKELYNEWCTSTPQSFGTTIVLDAGNIVAIHEILEKIRLVDKTVPTGIVFDPTYPLVDGSTVHLLPIETCAFVFIDKNNTDVKFLLDTLKLHA